MPFDGSGNFNRVMNWVSDALAGIKITSPRHDSEDDNFASGLSNCITKDGQTQPTANIPMNGKRIVNLASPTVATDAATKGYVDSAGTAKAPLASPTFTGIPAAPTAAPGTNTTQLATTAFVAALGALKANLASPTFTGTPATPDSADGDNTTKIANTKFVQRAIALLKAAANTWGANQSINPGNLTVNTAVGQAIGVAPAPAAGAPGMQINAVAGAGNAAFISFNRNGAFAANFGLDTDNKWKVGGWSMGAVAYEIVTTGNYQALLLLQDFFESAQQTIAASALKTLPHGLGVKPKLYAAFLQCTTADLQWAVGDEIALNPGGGTGNKGIGMWPDATNMNVRIGSALPDIVSKTSGAGGTITAGSWRLVVRAWA